MAGRWHGVRGRRFVRPTLTIMPSGDGEEVRALAELHHKPWTAEEGELWVASFQCDPSLVAASQIELSVAPDITVALRRPGRDLARPGERLPAGRSVRAPRAKAGPAVRSRPGPPTAAEIERLASELVAATRALELERARRTSLDHALEDERATVRRLRTELGGMQAELELGRARQAQADEAEKELDAARRRLVEAEQRHEQLVREREHEREQAERRRQELVREREQAAQAHAATLTELHEGFGALEAARDALGDALDAPLAPAPAGADEPLDPNAAAPALPRSARPVNPSLRHRTYWLGRVLALLLLAVVVAAIWIVIRSTIVH